MSKPRIQFFGGTTSIGGTQIIVSEGDHRILFDFGTPFGPGSDFFAEGLVPRPGAAGLRDLVGLRYLPRMDGIYQPGCAEPLDLAPAGDGRTEIFISHLHLDHMSGLSWIADSVPVHMHRDSLRLFRAVAETGEPPAVPAGAQPFEWDQAITVGPLRITPLPVDHDIPGAAGLVIETSDGAVVYTGDLRAHGSAPEQVVEFVRRAAALRPQILLIEGTRLWPPSKDGATPHAVLTEPEVAATAAEAAARSPGLALITLYPRNVQRIVRLAEAAAAVGRALVLCPETAHIYLAMGGDPAAIAVFKRARDLAALSDGSAPDWLSHLFAGDLRAATAVELRREQRSFLLQLNYRDLPELVDLRPEPGSCFIHSNGEPLGPFQSGWETFKRWLEEFGLNLVMVSSTGHADPLSLGRIAATIAPEILMPIHSHHPQLLEVDGIRRVLPERGAIYAVGTGALVG